MRRCLHRAPSLPDLARAVNLSPSRLHSLFKQETGLPPARYLRLLRLSEARRLLETTFLTVKQVMARVGAADESHFVRDFRKAFGMTPARYREHSLAGAEDPDGDPTAAWTRAGLSVSSPTCRTRYSPCCKTGRARRRPRRGARHPRTRPPAVSSARRVIVRVLA